MLARGAGENGLAGAAAILSLVVAALLTIFIVPPLARSARKEIAGLDFPFEPTSGGGVFAVSGDTKTNSTLWPVLNACDNLKALIIEVSFPNELQELADRAGHYCPATMCRDLRMLRHKPEIWLTGMKPGGKDGGLGWSEFRATWGFWNHLRWIGALAAATSFVVAIAEGSVPVPARE